MCTLFYFVKYFGKSGDKIQSWFQKEMKKIDSIHNNANFKLQQFQFVS